MVHIKKYIVLTFVHLGLALALPMSVYAISSTTDVSGVITINSNTVNGANVVVICNNHSQTTITDSKGFYTVRFSSTDCPDGSKATVAATQNNLGGVVTAPIQTGAIAAFSVNIIDTSVPEFGLLAGLVAAISGGILFLYIRRGQFDKSV